MEWSCTNNKTIRVYKNGVVSINNKTIRVYKNGVVCINNKILGYTKMEWPV